MRKFSVIKIAVLAAVLVKILVLAIGSYPFDFATYVYQARSFFEYGITPLFYWNKGLPLLGLFFSQYAIYQFIIQQLSNGVEHTALLHLLFKLPLLCFDVLTAFVIRDILLRIGKNRNLANTASLMWLINPFVLWIVEFQGQYGIIAAFLSLLSISLVLRKRYVLAMVPLALSASVYYYALIFFPFLLLKAAADGKKQLIKMTTGFFGTLLACYLPFLWSGGLLLDLFGSLLHHSAPDAGSPAQVVTLTNYSLLKIPYYMFSGSFPTNLTAPVVLQIAQALTFGGLVLIASYFLVRLRRYRKERRYTGIDLLADLLFITTIFLVLVGKLQDHYFIWVFPLMIIFGLATGARSIMQSTFVIGAIALLLVVSSHSIGVELLDILPFGTLNYYVPFGDYAQALGGFVVVLMLSLNLVASGRRGPPFHEIVPDSLIYVFASGAFLWFIYIALYSHVAMSAVHQPSTLGSDGNVYNFGYVATRVSGSREQDASDPEPLGDAGFETDAPTDSLPPNSYMSPEGSPWFFYDYGKSAGVKAQILSTSGMGGSHAFGFDVSPLGGKAQLNMGSNGSAHLLPVTPLERYEASGYINSDGVPRNFFSLAVRFADAHRMVIPGSDIKLSRQGPGGSSWSRYSGMFEPPHGAAFAELIFTVDAPAKVVAAGRVLIDDVSLVRHRAYQTVALRGLEPGSNAESLRRYVLHAPSSRYFHYDVQLDREAGSERAVEMSLGNCSAPEAIYTAPTLVDARFPPGCLEGPKPADLTVKLVNYPQEPMISVSLTHDTTLVHDSAAHPHLLNLFAIAGALISLAGLAVVTWLFWPSARGLSD